MWFRTKWVVLWTLWAARVARVPTPPLRVSSGELRGSISPRGTHAAYVGIPYATIKGRFQAPGPEPIWNGVFEAIEDHISCRQAWSLGSKYTSGQEDCQILNVFTPLNIDRDKPLPVMVYIHGGAFFRRSSARFIYGPEYLISKGVVLVTLNYRLGAQGFMCLGIKEAPGNAGMKDQVAALKWVQKNIRQFGGDPDDVTIVGESAGAASVSLHVLSPMSKGLFHKAIVQSGASIASWVFQYDPVNKASLQAKEMGFISQDPLELYKFFMSRTDSELVVTRIPRTEGTIITLTEIIYSPCAEKTIDGEEPFLTDLPYNLLIKGKYNKVPMIIGANTEEGLMFAGADDVKMLEKIDFYKALPDDLEFTSNEKRKEVANKLKQMYMGDSEISVKTIPQISRFYGEPFNNFGPVEETSLIAKTSDQPVWHYLFGYSGRRNVLKLAVGFKVNFDFLKLAGATHGDELFYLFSQEIIPSLFENDMIEKMTTLWTNFIKYGDPTPSTSDILPVKWLPVTPENQQALYIDKEMKTIPLWYRESLLVWKDVFSKYRRKYQKKTV